jgi:hypothetical protein
MRVGLITRVINERFFPDQKERFFGGSTEPSKEQILLFDT